MQSNYSGSRSLLKQIENPRAFYTYSREAKKNIFEEVQLSKVSAISDIYARKQNNKRIFWKINNNFIPRAYYRSSAP